MRGDITRKVMTDGRERVGVPKPRPQKNGRRYAWDKWFEAGRFTLLRHRDFTCMTHGMAAMVRNVASKKGYRTSVKIVSNDRIEVRAWPRAEREGGEV